jgi:hypothetical protein
MRARVLAGLFCLASVAVKAQGTSIADFGASSDPGHDNTAAINRCLDAAATTASPSSRWRCKP